MAATVYTEREICIVASSVAIVVTSISSVGHNHSEAQKLITPTVLLVTTPDFVLFCFACLAYIALMS